MHSNKSTPIGNLPGENTTSDNLHRRKYSCHCPNQCVISRSLYSQFKRRDDLNENTILSGDRNPLSGWSL
eukprot:8279856-Pyramimonas_sp.AAC.1